MTWKAKFSKKGANKGRGRGGRGRGRGGSSRTGGAQRSDSSALRLAEREMLEVEELGKRIVLEAPALGAQPALGDAPGSVLVAQAAAAKADEADGDGDAPLHSNGKKRRRRNSEMKGRRVKVKDPDSFATLPISRATLRGLKVNGYTQMTAIQKAAIMHGLAGRDILAAAQTGSGKTLAFLVPLLEMLFRNRWDLEDGLGALVITPVRELAHQIFEVLRLIGAHHSFSAGLIIGGKELLAEQERIAKMNVLICTPGRLLQHTEQTPYFDVHNLHMLVLDEADRCLDLGFAKELNAIVRQLPRAPQRQTLLFSATQTKSVKNLARLSLKDPQFLAVHEKKEFATPDNLSQSFIVCDIAQKLPVAWSFIKAHLHSKTLMFLASCQQVNFVFRLFSKFQPGISIMCLHGRMKQMKRLAVCVPSCLLCDLFSLPSFLAFENSP